MRLLLLSLIGFVLLTACGPKPDPALQIQQAVAATLRAIPSSTPAPIPTPYPTLTPFDLTGLFCEYRFCIGHPADLAFFDVSAQRNPMTPSSASQGLLAGYTPSLFVQVIWQASPGAADPQPMFDLVLDKALDARAGDLTALLFGGLSVQYVPITSTATAVLPYGGAAVWACGGRLFGWKTYTPQADLARLLLEEALRRFRCSDN